MKVRSLTKRAVTFDYNFVGVRKKTVLKNKFKDCIAKNQKVIEFKLKKLICNPEMEFKEFEPRFKSAKPRFKFSAGLNLETFNTILSGTNHI